MTRVAFAPRRYPRFPQRSNGNADAGVSTFSNDSAKVVAARRRGSARGKICEHLPRLAKMANKFALVRFVSHANSNHTPMIYYTLTGRETQLPEQDNDVRPPHRDDFPHLGSMLARFKPSASGLPAFVAIPEVAAHSSTSGEFKRALQPLRGGRAAILGPRYIPPAAVQRKDSWPNGDLAEALAAESRLWYP